MATNNAKTRANQGSQRPRVRDQFAPGTDPMAPQQPLVSAAWLAKAFGIAILAAFVCAYLAVCLLFYQGQWQIVFHPSRTVSRTPAAIGLPYDGIHFAYTETGQPQLTGWWLPAASGAGLSAGVAGNRYSSYTFLYFHGSTGSLSDTLDQLSRLHSVGINIFTFDYRGFGQSESTHPSEQRVYEDADAAFAYLTNTRHLDPKSIVLYGEGLGATIAAETAQRHPQAPALILENPAPPAMSLIAADARTSILPIRLLFKDRFELAPKLASLPTPKLLLISTSAAESTGASTTPPPFLQAASPKMTVTVANTDPEYLKSLRRFLDEYLSVK